MQQRNNSKETASSPYYPGTDIRMLPGDVLYSHKYGFSSFLVGHTGIVGTNYRIYHVNGWKKFGHADTVPSYLSRHRLGEKITILRHFQEEEAKQAAEWAMKNYQRVKRYKYIRDLREMENNYCSKFTWQAFYFGTKGKVDLLQRTKRKSFRGYVMPRTIFRRLHKISSFENIRY